MAVLNVLSTSSMQDEVQDKGPGELEGLLVPVITGVLGCGARADS
jgi:hypothetical protein